jgi:hypothetical protein
MSRVPWNLFQERQPRVHLVVAALANVATDGDDLAATLNLLKRLIRELKFKGDYAATVSREAGRPEIYLAFDDEGEAKQFASAFQAGPVASHAGGASQRAIELGSAKLATIEASLPTPKTKPRRQTEADGLRVVPGLRRAANSRYD